MIVISWNEAKNVKASENDADNRFGESGDQRLSPADSTPSLDTDELHTQIYTPRSHDCSIVWHDMLDWSPVLASELFSLSVSQLHIQSTACFDAAALGQLLFQTVETTQGNPRPLWLWPLLKARTDSLPFFVRIRNVPACMGQLSALNISNVYDDR